MPVAKIEKVEDISQTAKLYTLRSLSTGFTFEPGQYFSFLIKKDDGATAIRPYSFCSHPSKLPQFQICVRQISGGLATDYLKSHVGEEVIISQAQGNCVLPRDLSRPIAFLASGVGIAPVRSQLLELQRHPQAKYFLLYRFRDEGEFLFEKELIDMQQSQSGFVLAAIPYADFSEKFEDALRNYLNKEQDAELIIVGPGSFVSKSLIFLEQQGYKKERIHFDIWD